VFSIVSGYHEESPDGQGFYKLRAQSKDWIGDGGSGTVGFYNVYNNGDVVDSDPIILCCLIKLQYTFWKQFVLQI
jgi:hypothetical protein